MQTYVKKDKKKLCQFVLPMDFGRCGLPLTRDLRKNRLSLFQQRTIANSSFARGGRLCSAPISLLGLDMAWNCTACVHVVTTTVSPYVQLHCNVQKTLFPPSGSYILSSPSSAVIPETWCETAVPFRDGVPVSSSRRLGQLWISVNHHLLLKEP